MIQEDGCMRMRFENETGTGQIRAYEVFPGILLSYSDFRLERCESTYARSQNMFGFECCLEGKIQWDRQDGQSAFLGAGSLMPYDYEQSSGRFLFPQRNYRGISFGIQPQKAAGQLPEQFPVDLEQLKARFHWGNNLDLSHSPQAVRILGLIQEAEHQTDLHRKLACLELLLFLQDLKWSEAPAVPLYLPSAQVQKLRQAVGLILEHLDHQYTLQELSEAVHIPVTTLRRQFSGIYGCSAAQFARKHRIEEAQRLLRETGLNTSQIAARLGYDNPSKFAAVFRAETRMAPQEYRSMIHEQNGA